MTLHWGPTQFPGCLRFFQGTISTKSWKQDCYFEHPIERWYGLSIGGTFLGIIRVGRTRDARDACQPADPK